MEGGKWGLVIVASTFLIQMFTFGVSASIGVYNIEFIEYFNQDTVGVSLITAFNWASFMATGPLCSFLMTRVSAMKIALLGSVMVVVGIFLMPFLPSIPAFCICFGVLAGSGTCLLYVPSFVLCGLYYQQHQSLSTGIANSGLGFGGAIMPIVIGKLIEYYGWKGSLIIVAGMELHLIVFAALLRPPPVSEKQKPSDNEAQMVLKDSEVKVDSIEDNAAGSRSEEKELRVSLDVPKDIDNLTVEKHSECSERDENGTAVDVSKIMSTYGAHDMRQGYAVQIVDQSAKPKQTDQNPGTRPDGRSTACLTRSKRRDSMLPNVRLFTDISFDMYFISSLLWNATNASVLAFAPDAMVESRITHLKSAWLLTISGLGTFVGSIIGGVTGNIWVVGRRTQYIWANIVMGICICFFPLASTFGGFTSIMLSWGLAIGVVGGLSLVVLIDLIGSGNLSDGLCYVQLGDGTGSFCGVALTGYIREATGKYDVAFYLAGLQGVLAGVIIWLIPVIKYHFLKRKPLD